MVDMRKDVILHGTAFNSVYNAGFHVPAGGKTGTTNDGNDVWFIGYTADLVAGVWIGMDLPTKIKANAQGGILAAPAWTAFMTEVYRRKPTPPDWPRPDGLISRDIDKTTGMLANPYCPLPVVYTEWYLPGTEPTQQCDVHSATNTSVGDTLRRVPLEAPTPPTPAASAPKAAGPATRVSPGTAPMPTAAPRP
jgi:membrane carboxypeptidase/penicillin-binding protein